MSDRDIKRLLDLNVLQIDDLLEENIQPASIDLRLELDIVLPDLRNENFSATQYEIEPSQFLLARTIERVKIPNGLVARVEGKSSWGRKGLLVHATAGYIDPGFEGTITLELYNLSAEPITLKQGQNICQLSLIILSSEALRPYGHAELNSKYQFQTETTGSKL